MQTRHIHELTTGTWSNNKYIVLYNVSKLQSQMQTYMWSLSLWTPDSSLSVQTLDPGVIVLSCCSTLFGRADWFFIFTLLRAQLSCLHFPCLSQRLSIKNPSSAIMPVRLKEKLERLLIYSPSVCGVRCDEWSLRCTTYLCSPCTTGEHYHSVPSWSNTLPVCSKHHFASWTHSVPSQSVVAIR